MAPAAQEGYIERGGARLDYRVVGRGLPIVVLHGGPDFDHAYLLPDLDRLAEEFRLVYYDQRGRGRSAAWVSPEDVSIESEIADLDAVRSHFGLESAAILGHSWGGLLAMEYALRHPHRVSHLVLLNTAPASHDDVALTRRRRQESSAADLEHMRAIAATPEYERGDLAAEAAYYRIHFRTTLRPEHLEHVVRRLRAHFTPEGVRTARAIELRLYRQTWDREDYDLVPGLARLAVPTLVVHGDRDLIPLECARRIADAIPRARLVVPPDSGHFAYLDRPGDVRRALTDFLAAAARVGSSARPPDA